MEQFNENDMHQILELINVPIIKDDTNYWFIRTNAGENFEKFYFKNYVAIGWDKIDNLQAIIDEDRESLKRQVEKLYPEETKPGSIASQISRFVNEVKIGDYVMIPGSNCDRIAFGIIKSDAYIYEPTFDDQFDILVSGKEIDFLKRRDVEWLTTSPFERNELDPLLLPIIYSYGTIVNANPYATFINRTLYSQYYHNGMFHTVLDVNKQNDISIVDFNNLINGIFSTLQNYSEISGFEVNLNELCIKATINSPGPVEIITTASSLLIGLSALSLFLNGANLDFTFNIFKNTGGHIKIDSPGLLDKIEKLKNSQNSEIQKQIQKELEGPKEKLEIKKKRKKK